MPEASPLGAGRNHENAKEAMTMTQFAGVQVYFNATKLEAVKFEWGWLHIFAAGGVAEAETAPGWVELGWEDCGGYDPDCQAILTEDEFDRAWATVRDAPGVEEYADDETDTRALFCRVGDVLRVRQLIGEFKL